MALDQVWNMQAALAELQGNKPIFFKQIIPLSFLCWCWLRMIFQKMIYLIQFMCYGSEKVTFIIILKLAPSYKSTENLTRKQHSFTSV